MTNPNANPVDILQRPTAYEQENKTEFHRVSKKLLHRLMLALDKLGDYGDADPIRSNMGGIAVSGEITLHTDMLYVQVSQPALGMGKGIMFRSCKGRDDYTGGTNHFAPLHMLTDPQALAKLIQTHVPFKVNIT